ncbi:ComF family protein [Olivibacter sp. SDN3]|uniref:ComF family protein n=1 Tax=Olivibacter sp. SDN3 TaxID=2764720 RepID=UPI001651459D|nr:phosphoribosyltransferase family protein [Olivibacter sp. SDN3]QNL50885.1 ComF family protein [Olivibacter sp. SDN3]
MSVAAYIKDFVSLFYPDLCVGCNTFLYDHEQLICSYCWYNLPVTNFHRDSENASAKQLWGRVKLKNVASYLYFGKGSNVQQILHHLKYFSKPKIGLMLGEEYGKMLSRTDFNTAEIIVPVPLHPKKMKTRGYNQSAYFGEGMSTSMNIPMIIDNLIRHTLAESQTTKKRYERYENMRTIFKVKQPEVFADKHILLVDDVLTTGATIEACAQQLLEIPGVKVSVATLAYTK